MVLFIVSLSQLQFLHTHNEDYGVLVTEVATIIYMSVREVLDIEFAMLKYLVAVMTKTY